VLASGGDAPEDAPFAVAPEDPPVAVGDAPEDPPLVCAPPDVFDATVPPFPPVDPLCAASSDFEHAAQTPTAKI
jgi:hypothetical protein